MRLLARFGGILGAFAFLIGFGILGFVLANPVLVFIALLCWWPLLIGILGWTVRGLRDNYQLVPKNSDKRVGQQQTARERF